MDRAQLNQVCKRVPQDAGEFLRALRAIDQFPAKGSGSVRAQLSKTDAKLLKECRAAAIFCLGQSHRIGQAVSFVPIEDSDYDFLATWRGDDKQHFAPVQLKEVVPERKNRRASIQLVLDSLNKYVNSKNLTVAIHLNQTGRFEPKGLRLPNIELAAIWVFWASSADQSQWRLYGNLLETPEFTCFAYPAT